MNTNFYYATVASILLLLIASPQADSASVNGTYKLKSGSGSINLAGLVITLTPEQITNYGSYVAGKAKVKKGKLKINKTGMLALISELPGNPTASITGKNKIKLKQIGPKAKYKGSANYRVVAQVPGFYTTVLRTKLKTRVVGRKMTITTPLDGTITFDSGSSAPGVGLVKIVGKR